MANTMLVDLRFKNGTVVLCATLCGIYAYGEVIDFETGYNLYALLTLSDLEESLEHEELLAFDSESMSGIFKVADIDSFSATMLRSV